MRDIISQLNNIRGRSRTMLLLQRLAVTLSWILGAIIVVGMMDFLFRFPGGFRMVLLVGGLGLLGWFGVKYVFPALGFHPTLTDVALRIERAIPSLDGRLASSVEFSTSGLAERNTLAARSMRDAASRVHATDISSVFRTGPTKRDGGIFLGVALIAILITALSPASAATGLRRVLLPLGDATWPARTGVASLIDNLTFHPRGQALALVAEGTKAPGNDLANMDIRAHYRFQSDEGSWSPWREVFLIHQGGARYEQLVDTDAQAIEVYFTSQDDQTAPHEIAFIPPPAIENATLHVTPPDYAETHRPERMLQLGTGLDERAMTESPILVGSTMKLTLTLTKEIPVPDQGPERNDWMRTTFGWPGELPLPTMRSTGASQQELIIQWSLSETTGMAVDLVDAYGVHSVDDIAFRIDAIEDRVPTVTMTRPESDEAVLAGAIVPVVGEARDDVAINGIGLEVHRAAPAGPRADNRLWREWEDASSPASTIARDLDIARFELKEGDVVEVTSIAKDNFRLDGEEHEQIRSAPRRLRIISERDFGQTILRELRALRENAIRLETNQAELQDDIIDNSVQPGNRTAQDRIGEQLADQLDALERVRERTDMNNFEDNQLDALIRQSEDLLRHAGRASNDASAAIAQRQRQQQQQQARNAEAGGRGDPPTDDNARTETPDAQDTPEGQQPTQDARGNQEAGEPQQATPDTEGPSRAGENAEEQSPDAGAQPDDQDAPNVELREPREEDREVVENQQKVREELRDLIEALDRNQDSWVMNQRIHDLLEQQTEVQASTQQLGNQTRGKPVGELSQEEMSELDRIAQRQRELAREMRDLVDELRDRSDELSEVDPQAAEAQRSAAEIAEQQEIDRDMEQAGNQASRNQMQNAQNSQQRARQNLQQMLDRMDERGARAEELQRQLESLIESIKRLVTMQEEELTALARARADDTFTGRDRAMIRLNQQTQAVSTEARAAGDETARVARTLDRAADAQASAVGYLRERPVNHEDATVAETRSLELLREARTLAEELEQQVEEELAAQRREALLEQYSALAEREVALRTETLKLQELDQLDRRALVDARRHSNTQEDIRAALETIASDTTEVSDSIVFRHVHTLLDQWGREVTENLRGGEVGPIVTDRQRAIADGIGRIIKALEEEQAEQDPFEQDEQSGAGGGGGGGQGQPQPLIPPLAELKLLRGMQEQIYDQTRTVDTRPSANDAIRRQQLRELGRMQEDLLDLGQQMLEALSPNAGGPPNGGGSPPDQPRPEGPGR